MNEGVGEGQALGREDSQEIGLVSCLLYSCTQRTGVPAEDPKVLDLMSFQSREAIFFLFLQNRHHPSGAGFSGGATSRPQGTRRGRR